MVVDEGFDLSIPVFRGKIAAAFTLECSRGNDVIGALLQDDPVGAELPVAADWQTSQEARKQSLLASLEQPDGSCQLREGIGSKPNPFVDLESQRQSWNAAIRTSQLAAAPPLADQILMRLWAVPFHGTATAGIIADTNPNARLVLVEKSFTKVTPGGTASSCMTQENLDRATRLLSDPEVQAAYVNRPLSASERLLTEVASLTGAEIVNESYGKMSRAGVEASLSADECPAVDLTEYFRRIAALDLLREESMLKTAPLVIKAAGNESAKLTDGGDSTECRLGQTTQLLVGSYGTSERRSSFSNYGACVDVYAPGEDVIIHVNGDWLFPLSGTSFAAPMVAGLLTTIAPRPFQRQEARDALLGCLRRDRTIPLDSFAQQLLWQYPQAEPSIAAAPLRSPAVAATRCQPEVASRGCGDN